MMVLGLEEPLHWSKQLYAFDEINHECKLSKVEDDGLNRYSFIWLGEYEQRDARHQDLIKAITEQRGEDPCWYLIWGLPEDHAESIEFQARRQSRTGDGWEVHHGESFAVAQKMCELDQLAGFRPANHRKHPGDGGLFLIWGNAPAGPDLVKPPTLVTLEDFCERRELAPSSPFLSWVRSRKLTFMYPLRDQQSHLGLVVVTPLAIDIEALKSCNLVSKVHEGRDAGRAWCYMDENG